jgi:SAM-dependent methyltransferase
MLDVGGNSGEFLVQACHRHAGLSGTVLDLPVVCDVGLEHVLGEPERARIGFLKGDIRREPLPAGYDLITFKSMLHDWPLEDASRFLEKAAHALEPGGTVLIYERAPLEVRETAPAFSALPLLMFFRSYRSPGPYLQKLQALGLVDFRCLEFGLDTPFFVVTARKPA